MLSNIAVVDPVRRRELQKLRGCPEASSAARELYLVISPECGVAIARLALAMSDEIKRLQSLDDIPEHVVLHRIIDEAVLPSGAEDARRRPVASPARTQQ